MKHIKLNFINILGKKIHNRNKNKESTTNKNKETTIIDTFNQALEKQKGKSRPKKSHYLLEEKLL